MTGLKFTFRKSDSSIIFENLPFTFIESDWIRDTVNKYKYIDFLHENLNDVSQIFIYITVSAGSTDIVFNCSEIHYLTYNFPKNIEQQLYNIPTNPLLTNDSRLDNLDIQISSRLSSTDTRLDNLDTRISTRVGLILPHIWQTGDLRQETLLLNNILVNEDFDLDNTQPVIRLTKPTNMLGLRIYRDIDETIPSNMTGLRFTFSKSDSSIIFSNLPFLFTENDWIRDTVNNYKYIDFMHENLNDVEHVRISISVSGGTASLVFNCSEIHYLTHNFPKNIETKVNEIEVARDHARASNIQTQ